MIALYLDDDLDEDQLEEVEEAVGDLVECRRVPWLTRVGATPDADVLGPHLRAAGVGELPEGERVLLVAPSDLGWVTALAEAIRAQRGTYPLLVQTAERRAESGQPGPLRILDMEAYLLDEDAAARPPWAGPEDRHE